MVGSPPWHRWALGLHQLALSEKVSPQKLVRLLDEVVSHIDDMATQHGLEKIKTIGDAYMVAAGIPEPRPDHAAALAEFALELNDWIGGSTAPQGHDLQLRIGINSGPVVAGVIGKQKFSYDLWGDCVNTAARMESHGLPGEIQITEATRQRLGESFRCEARGEQEIKGKGAMTTYLLRGRATPAG
jgi:adenylate cyclase